MAGDGAWNENYEYKYKLVQKTLLKLPGANERGMVASVRLTIRPQADNTWIGQITETELSKLDEQDYDYDSTGVTVTSEKKPLQDVPLNKLFKVFLKNGVIDTLSVDQTMTEKETNLVKFAVSQFQVDTKGQNLIQESEHNARPDLNSTNAYFMTMEPTALGVCKTNYDISRLPEYLAYAQYDSIPSLAKYAGEGDVIQIIKHTNYNNCNNELSDNVVDRDNREEVNDLINTRIIISGSLDKYILHSSASTGKNEAVTEYIYLTLESMELANGDRTYRFSPRFGNMENFGSMENMQTLGNMKNVGNLVQRNVY